MASKSYIIALIALIIAGSLLGREYPLAGFIVSLSALGLYLILTLGRTIAILRNRRKVSKGYLAQAAVWFVLLGLTVFSVFAGTIPYFLLLVVIAIEYILQDKRISGE